VIVRRGSIHLARAVHDRYFPGLEAVVLLRRDDDLLILPVRQAAAGGYLLKLRNSAGDRVVDAADFLRANGVDDSRELTLSFAWHAECAGLVASGVFRLQT
jgi:hypothetical protein